MAVAETITEINAIIDALKTLADAGTELTGTAKTAMETRIAHLRDKTSPHGVNTLTDDLTNLQQKAILGEAPPTPAPVAGKKAICGLGFRIIGFK